MPPTIEPWADPVLVTSRIGARYKLLKTVKPVMAIVTNHEAGVTPYLSTSSGVTTEFNTLPSLDILSRIANANDSFLSLT